jgi:hypothetical protein
VREDCPTEAIPDGLSPSRGHGGRLIGRSRIYLRCEADSRKSSRVWTARDDLSNFIVHHARYDSFAITEDLKDGE